MSLDAPKDSLNVRCRNCGHKFVAAWLPMRLDMIAAVLRDCHCPMCGTDSHRIQFEKTKEPLQGG